MNRNNNIKTEFHDNWFKVKYVNRRNMEDVDYSYCSGHNKFFVKYDLQQSIGLDYIIYVKPISYDQMIRELTVDREDRPENVLEFPQTRNFSQDS
jgi:hypothetical protein